MDRRYRTGFGTAPYNAATEKKGVPSMFLRNEPTVVVVKNSIYLSYVQVFMLKNNERSRWVRSGKRTHLAECFGGILPSAEGIYGLFWYSRTTAGGPPALQFGESTATESRSRNRGCRGITARRGYRERTGENLESKRFGCCVPLVNEGIKL